MTLQELKTQLEQMSREELSAPAVVHLGVSNEFCLVKYMYFTELSEDNPLIRDSWVLYVDDVK